MDKQQLLRIDDDRVPALGLGTWNLNGNKCIETVTEALRMGYRHLDTAQMYENEKEVGMGIKQSNVDKGELFVTTKISTSNLYPEAIKSSTDESLRRLDTGTIDLLLIHWPVPQMDLEDCLSAMFRLREEGKVKHVGVSNFSPHLFRQSIRLGPVVCNQVEFSPYRGQDENLKVARDAGIMITAYSPLAKGRVSRDKKLAEIGGAYQKTAAQVALRWLLQQGPVSVIPKASSGKHLEENMKVFDFELNEKEMAEIYNSITEETGMGH